MSQPKFLARGRAEGATGCHRSPSHHRSQTTDPQERGSSFFINRVVLAHFEKEFGKLCVTVPPGDSPTQMGATLIRLPRSIIIVPCCLAYVLRHLVIRDYFFFKAP